MMGPVSRMYVMMGLCVQDVCNDGSSVSRM